MKTFRILLKDGWSIGVKADSYQIHRKGSSMEQTTMSAIELMVDGQEVFAAPLAELIAIADEAALAGEPQRSIAGAAPEQHLVGARRSSGNGKRRHS